MRRRGRSAYWAYLIIALLILGALIYGLPKEIKQRLTGDLQGTMTSREQDQVAPKQMQDTNEESRHTEKGTIQWGNFDSPNLTEEERQRNMNIAKKLSVGHDNGAIKNCDMARAAWMKAPSDKSKDIMAKFCRHLEQ